MGRLWYLFGTVLLVGCTLNRGAPSPFLDEGGTGGNPTTSTCDEGILFDKECGQVAPCCIQGPTKPFQGPDWFEIGAPDTIKACPEPTMEGVTGYADMKLDPQTCGACSCSPAACTLPEGIHTNAAKCPGDGSVAVPFGPSAGWEGVCSAENPLPANIQCGGVPCAQSVTVPALPIAPCKPESGPADPFPDPAWGRVAHQCIIESPASPDCGANQICPPQPPEGFLLCLYAPGKQPTCPTAYPTRMVFYTGITDNRGCDECECGPQEGAECTAYFQVFSDPTCGIPEGAVAVSDQEPACFDVLSGTALQSAEAFMVVDVLGSCEPSGGAPSGGVELTEPITLCCEQKAPG